MLIQARSSHASLACLTHHLRQNSVLLHYLSLNVSSFNGFIKRRLGPNRRLAVKTSASGEDRCSSTKFEKKRKVVEHISLLKIKENISEEEEKNMLDYLYTTQYQMGGIVAISLGRVSDQNLEKYTHAVYMRFQKKDNLEKFYANPFYSKVMKEHVMPYCNGFIHVDYETEVEDDILPIFRKGEEFNYGVEFVLLISFAHNEFDGPVDDALASLDRLINESPSLIVQSTQGMNINLTSKEFTHGVVIRFRSFKAFEIFTGSSEYKNMWRSEFQPITQKTISVHFCVDPVGTELM